jgi:hypothetical protein
MKVGRFGELRFLPTTTPPFALRLPPFALRASVDKSGGRAPFSAAYYVIVKERFRIVDDGRSQDRNRGCLAGCFRGKIIWELATMISQDRGSG